MTTMNVFDTQSKFSKLHIPFIFIIILFIIERSIKLSETNAFYSLWFFIPILFTEIIVCMKKFFGQEKLLFVVRYIELSMAAFLFAFTDYIYFAVIASLIFCILLIEFIALFDYSEMYYRFTSGIFIGIPVIGSIYLSSYLKRNINDISLIQLGVFSSLIIIIMYYTILNEKSINQIEKQLFRQNHLLNNVNETNEALKLQQEKVKKANEELGYQKVMLEAAYTRINNRNTEIMLQNQVLKYISSSLEIDELMNLITNSMFRELELSVCAIALNPNVIGNKNVLYKIKTSFSKKYEYDLGNLIEREQFNSYLCSDNEYIDNHVVINKYEFTNKVQLGSLLIAPLIRKNKQIGFIFVGSKKYDNFVDNATFYQVIVAQILIALNNVNMYAKMHNMAIRDGLTGVYNRGHLTKLLNVYIEEAIAKETPITLALLDIDKFKTINDTYGHLFGDVIIQTIATIADEMAVENDGIVGRYGGEEFVIIFPGKSLEEAYELIKKLKMNIREKEISHKDEILHVNVSVGVTSFPQTCKNPHELLNRADWAMYYSKQNGRDLITIDSNEVREKLLMK